jgi:hypothetical protein
MPTTHLSEAALERRREKVALVQQFPGRLESWEEAVGRTVAGTAGPPGTTLLVFTDGTFLLAAPGSSRPDDLLAALLAARDLLAPHRHAALYELDRRVAAEQEAMRLARMEKVIGAVETNLPEIPELREALLRVLENPDADQ